MDYQRKVLVDLPFVKDPVKALTHCHGTNNNYLQAIKVYQQQVRKPEAMMEKCPSGLGELSAYGETE